MGRIQVPHDWVPGEGPLPCSTVILGESPGWQENRDKRPFVGKTGGELNRHLERPGLPRRQDIYVTNLYKNYKGEQQGKGWAAEDLSMNAPILIEELYAAQPSLIITLGRESTRYLLGDVRMEGVWGIPWMLRTRDGLTHNPALLALVEQCDPVVFPIHHPAAGMHNPELSPYVMVGFEQLAEFLAGHTVPRVIYDDPYPEPTYVDITSEAQLATFLAPLTSAGVLAIDTEGWPGRPWSIQLSYQAGHAGCLRASANTVSAGRLFNRLTRCLSRVRPQILFHSALHDQAMLRNLGVDVRALPFDDTMTMAYLLQVEPQGLKDAALRHCNMPMQDYTELMGDVENDRVRDYLTWIYDAEQADYEEAQHEEFERQRAAGRRIKVLPKLPRTPLQKATTRVLGSPRPAALWADQVEDVQVAGYARLGPVPRSSLDDVSPAAALYYSGRDADATLRLFPEYRRRIDTLGLREVYELELSTYPLLDRMQQIGMKPDLAHFAQLSTLLQYEIDGLRGRLEALTGRPGFNANSGDQVADYLFGLLQLEEIKRTAGGRGSTNDKILEALEKENPEIEAIGLIRRYREFYKLKHTFVDRLPEYVHRWPHDGRVHTTIRATRVITGRLASADPNMLAQPEHGVWAEEFRRGWVAEDGHLLCQWDESQVELRGLAHLSQDPVLLSVYRGERRNPDGSLVDLHAALAERIFGVKPKDQNKHTHRLPAKAVNFSIPMGITAKGLSVELRKNGVDADEDTAQRWLDETLQLYTGVRDFMEERKAEARSTGMVRCLSGRLRYIGGIRSRDDRVREEAERFAFSTPIQESAAYIIKQAEAAVWTDILPYFWARGQWVEPLLQVHDCLKMECEEGVEQELHTLMTEVMTNVPKGFSVPLAVEGEYGPTFADMRRFQ